MKKIIAILVLGLILLSGCQNNSDIKKEELKSKTDTNGVTTTSSHGDPYSKGPSGPPEVKGPSAPPPQAQAVTKNENIRLTLPLKST